jgi:hypothetical protein
MRSIIFLIATLLLSGYSAKAQKLRLIATKFYCNGHFETFSEITDIIQTKDNGFFFVGATADGGGGILPTCTSTGLHAVMGKLDSLGNVQWIKNQCGITYYSSTVCQTPDGGYAMNGGPVTSGGGIDIYRYDSFGNLLWQKNYGKNADCGTLK